MVRADLQGLVPAHDNAGLAVLDVLEETNISGSAFLPLARFLHELEELGAHLEKLLLRLLVGLGLDLLGQVDDGLEVNVLGLGRLFLFERDSSVIGLFKVAMSRAQERNNNQILPRRPWRQRPPLGFCAAGVVTSILILDLLLFRAARKHGENLAEEVTAGFSA